MIIVLKQGSKQSDVDHISEKLKELGLKVHISQGEETTIIGAIGDERVLRETSLAAYPAVEKILPILKPFKLASREFRREDSRISVGEQVVGGENVSIMAGPCTVESRDGLLTVAREVKRNAPETRLWIRSRFGFRFPDFCETTRPPEDAAEIETIYQNM